MPHIPVLLQEIISGLEIQKGNFVIDGTCGSGGHSQEIASHIGSTGKLLMVDWDPQMLTKCRKALERIRVNKRFVTGNYRDLPDILHREKLPRADALFLDLGFSSEHIENSNRGFSYGDGDRHAEELLMTYNDERTPVYQILKTISETELMDLLKQYGEERYARRIARAIIEQEHKNFITTNLDLTNTVVSAVPRSYEHKRIHPATRTFQALRIYANSELENLEKTLENLHQIVRRGGRVAIVSFHSLEDRLVKHYFRKYVSEERLRIITKKPIIATQFEKLSNPRSRSAKLRVAIVL